MQVVEQRLLGITNLIIKEAEIILLNFWRGKSTLLLNWSLDVQ